MEGFPNCSKVTDAISFVMDFNPSTSATLNFSKNKWILVDLFDWRSFKRV